VKSLYYFIVKPLNNRYDNTRTVAGTDLIINSGIEDHRFISKKAVVVSTPAAYIFTIIYLEDGTIKKAKNEIVQLILKMTFILLYLSKFICII
jgi:hypothetical protein